MATRYWEGGVMSLAFDSGGTHEPSVGDLIVGETSEANGYLIAISALDSGSWAGGDADGTFYISVISGTFEDDETLEMGGEANVATVDGTIVDTSEDWSLAYNWSGDTVPTTSDTVIIDGRGSTACAFEGTIYDISDGIAVGETGGDSFPLLHVKSTYTGDIGTNEEKLHCDAEKVIYQGTGTMYLECSEADATTDSDIPLVICDSDGGTLNLSSNINSASYASDFTEVWAIRGTINLLYLSFIKTLRMMPYAGRDSALTVSIEADCTRLKATTDNIDVYMDGGTLRCRSTMDLLEIHGGTCYYGGDFRTCQFTSGGTHELLVGDTMTGADSEATATVDAINITSGTWANGDAAGYIRVSAQVGIFDDGEEVSDGTNNVGTLTANPAFEAGLDITTLNQYGGTVYWQPEDSGDDAYIGDLLIAGGTFDASDVASTGYCHSKVLGNGAGNDIHLLRGATMVLNNQRGNISIAASSQLWNLGGSLTVDDNSQIGLTYDAP